MRGWKEGWNGNARARAGILSIGATFEGVLRRWQPSQVPGEEAQLRDSAIYSVVDNEWPDVRSALVSADPVRA